MASVNTQQRLSNGLNEMPSAEAQKRFHELAQQWKREVQFISSFTRMCMHPAYQQIIGMGLPAVSLLLRELQDNPHHWFWALFAITGENPVAPDDAGDFEKMRAAWMEWGKNQGYE